MSGVVENFGRYQLLKKIASGGMAQIFLARQTGPEGFEKLLVVKRILPHLSEDDEFIRMFLDEARIAARLNHPNVVQIFDLGAEGGTFYIAMEYIHGEDVRRVWRKADERGKAMTVPVVSRIIMDACAGLDYAHRKTEGGRPLNIVHRDVSPQNILVTFEGGVKVVDFGIAKAADRATATKSGVLKGKYSYMSPEQAAGHDIDQRTDIFALGVVYYELLTGHRLFKKSSDIQTLNAVAECKVTPPSRANPQLPADLDEVVMKALTKSPNARYQHASEFQEAIEAYLLKRQLPASSLQVKAFMTDLYAERLKREAEAGRVLFEELELSKEQRSSEVPTGDDPDAGRPPPPPTDMTMTVDPVGVGTKASRPSRRSQPFEGTAAMSRAERSDEQSRAVTQTNRNKRLTWLWVAGGVALATAVGATWSLRSGSAQIHLSSVPSGAEVRLDRAAQPRCVTPCVLEGITAGSHRVEFRLPGGASREAELVVPATGLVQFPPVELEAPRPVAMDAGSTSADAGGASIEDVTFEVTASPEHALVFVNDVLVGPAPATVKRPGGETVRVRAEAPGFVAQTQEVALNAELQVVRFELASRPLARPDAGGGRTTQGAGSGTLRVVVTPFDTAAHVVCNGRNLGDLPFPEVTLPAGEYRCVFTAGARQKQTVARVKANERTVLVVDFSK